MSVPRLTVICPINNMAGRLSNLGTWVEELEGSEVEVFLIHDKTDEDTGIELRSIIESHPGLNLKFSEGVYGSAAAARNSVLNQCSGDWIAFWDSDDLPSYSAISKFLNSDSDVVVGNYDEVRFSGQVILNKHENSFTRLSFQPGIWRMLFKREIFQDLRFPVVKMGEDQAFLAQINWTNIRVHFSDDVFYKYHTGHTFQTTAKFKDRSSLLESIKFLQSLLKSNSCDEDFVRNLIARQSLTLLKSTDNKTRLQALNLIVFRNLNPRDMFEQVLATLRLSKFLLLERGL